MNTNSIGIGLMSARKKAAISQQQIADALDVGIATVSNWERGVSEPTVTKVVEWADMVGANTIDELIGRK